MYFHSPSFQGLYNVLNYHFKHKSSVVKTETWQGVSTHNCPEMRTHELLNVDVQVPLRGIEDIEYWKKEIDPNLPWADEHFAERVCGEPLNPPPSYKRWPWATAAEKATDDHGAFNHSYPERLWPKYAGRTDKGELVGTKFDVSYRRREMEEQGYVFDLPPDPHIGIRHTYGDLNDLVTLLVRQPHTRQAFIPLFFPEDTGVGDGGRKPCTLGYHFILRDNKLHVYYPLRSCDFVRHFKDDIYLAVRLLLWVLEKCRGKADFWNAVSPGEYHMHLTSFHVFENDIRRLP